MKKPIIEKPIDKFQILKRLRKDKRYLIIDEEPLSNYQEFRSFQRFIEKMVIISRHTGIKIYGSLVIERRDKE